MDKEATTTAKIIVASLIFILILAIVITLLKGGTPDDFISFLAGLLVVVVLISLIVITPNSFVNTSVIGTLKNWSKLSFHEKYYFSISYISYLAAFLLLIMRDLFMELRTIFNLLMILMFALYFVSNLLFAKKGRQFNSFSVKEQVYFIASLAFGIIAFTLLIIAIIKRFDELFIFGFGLFVFSAIMVNKFEKRIKEIDGTLIIK